MLKMQRMARIASFCLVIVLATFQVCKATTYTWNGTTSAWGVMTNWSPNGTPGPADNVIIVNAAAQPVLNAAQSITDFTITSGTLDLNTFLLTITGNATYTAGTINNGSLLSTGASSTFSGTVFGAIV